MDTNNTNTGSTPPPATPAPDNNAAATPDTAKQDQAANPLASAPSIQINKQDPAASAGIPQPASSSTGAVPPAPPAHHRSKPMMWVIGLLIFAFFCGLALAAWYFQSQLQQVTPAKTAVQTPSETPKKIVIGTDATFQPMEFVASGGAFMGYDIDLGNRIASDWGIEAEFKNISWDDLFTELDNKNIDMIMSSVTITDERKQNYDFSDSYLNAGQVVITRKDNTNITNAQSLQGKRIAVQEGTTNEEEAAKLTSPALVLKFPDYVQATEALINGQADAILSDLPGGKGIITANPTLKIATDPLTNEYYGIVFRKGDPNVQKVNETLSTLRTKGILTDLKQKWLD